MQYKISFQQIDYFLTVADVLSFTEAARILYISQPALSKQINVIETELGFPLSVRNKRHVVLTPEGISLHRDWKSLSQNMESSIYNAKLLRNHASGELYIGCSDTFDYSDVLPKLVRNFMSDYPQINVDASSHSFKTLRESLLADKMDIIFTPYFELDGLTDVSWMKLKDIPLSIIVPTCNPLSEKDSISLRDLKNESFILISPKDSQSGTERTQALCRRCGFNLKKVRYVPNVSSMQLAVQNGLGVAICNSKMFEHDSEMCKIYPLDITQDDSFLVAVWKKDRHNVAVDLFTTLLQNQFTHMIH